MPGICSSASLTADYGPGPEAAAEGCTAGRGICFLRLLLPTCVLSKLKLANHWKAVNSCAQTNAKKPLTGPEICRKRHASPKKY